MTHPEHSLIWALYLEGAAEDMIMSSLRKQQASPEEVSMFTRKENGKLLFRPDHVPTLLHWIRTQHADVATMVDDYKHYQKYFPNVKMDQFASYVDWTERVHAKRDESTYQSRHRDTGSIDIQGEDQKNVLADDEDVLILRGDGEHACVRYGRGYSFCISRPGGGNMYGAYRLSKASTFYFIFFKKIPRENERHIMVLDRTSEGWEWTFGKNHTRVVAGGWDEIAATFPQLVKYRDIFINKPLTPEETTYQEQLREFTSAPTKAKFDDFSYQQQADVLKFGMLIPLDVFQSLDKFQRNEWVSVGPKMTDDIYKQLSSGERDRFIKVREQQLMQRDPKDAFDVEITKNNPELFAKHLAADEQLSKKQERTIIRKIKNGTYDGDIKIRSKYYFPNLDSLKILNGHLDAASPLLNISLPQLQKCKALFISSILDLKLPQLQESWSIYAASAPSVSIPELQTCGVIEVNTASIFELPKLQTCRRIASGFATSMHLPQLQQCEDLYVAVEKLSLPKLQQSGSIRASEATDIDLPKLEKCTDVHARSASNINLPRLKQTLNIKAPSAKRIVVQHAMRAKIQHAPEDCEIIEPDAQQLNDSVLQDLMKKYLLAK